MSPGKAIGVMAKVLSRLCLCLCVAFACNRRGAAGQTPPASDAAEARALEANALAWLLVAEAEAEAQQLGTGGAGPADTAADSDTAPERRLPDVIYVPTPEAVVDKMLELAQVTEKDVLYDLGCGDGRIVIAAAERYGAKAKGFDIDPARVAEARANVKAAGVEDLVSIEQNDIFTLDLSPASVVTLYLLPELNVRLIPQLEKLAPGSRIVSHDFDMSGVEPREHVIMRSPSGRVRHEVYLWHTPLQKVLHPKQPATVAAPDGKHPSECLGIECASSNQGESRRPDPSEP